MEYSLTNPQNSIWLTEKFYQNTPINNISGYTYISEVVDFDVLTQAINEVIKTNDAMRIKIKEENDKCVQYISEYIPFSIEIINLSSENDIEKKSLELAKIPFNVEENTLFKFTFFKLPNQYGGFFLTAHHIIGDSWSLGLVVKQIMLNYCNIKNNTFSSKEHPSYVSYINDEKRYLESSKFLKDKEYWNDIFKTVPEIATIPSFKNVTNASSGNRSTFTFDIKLVKKINDFCKANNISLYNFFMSVYSLYLGRVSNLDDFVIGTPILNRTNFEQKNTVGMFISTTPLRVNLNHELTFVDFIKDISARTISLFRHQRYPYQYILEDLRKKDSSIPNLYNVVLSYQITKTFDEESGINYSAHWLTNGCCSDDLQIHLLDLNNEGSLHVAYDYRTDKYTEQDIADLHARILTIINQVMSNNDIVLKNIEIVTPEEKHKILYEFNNTKVDYPKNKTIVDLFEEQVAKTPDNIAVVFEDQKLTYRELNEKANQLARYLLTCNLSSSDNIGIFTNRSIKTIISILAILKAGKTFVPIDPIYPHERIDYMINSSNLSCIVSDTPMAHIKYSKNLEIIYVNSISSLNSDTSNLTIEMSSANNLYIIFTSGSTGKPKGLSISHRNIINLIYSELNNSSILQPGSRILQFATMSFDVSYQEIFSTLLTGNTLILISDEKRKNINSLIEHILYNNVSTLFIPPAYLQLIVENEKNIINISKTVKYIITAGESLLLTNGITNLLKSGITLFNHYGPAETHVATTYEVPSDVSSLSIPIGTPINNSYIYILDNYNNLCPPNIAGQIAIGGDCVGNGYIDKTLNKNKFIDNPFINKSKLYLTGDLGYIDQNDILHFIGRKDFQVKINGFRIELDEINKILLNYDNINSCVTVVQELNNKKYVVSYYTSDSTIKNAKIIEYLNHRLPKFMIPNYLMHLDSLPINNNGKIDKKSLPIPNLNSTNNIILPSTKTEEDLLEIWKKLLNLENISTDVDFFSIGGDSLLAIKLSAYIKSFFNIDITINDIFNNCNIVQLSSLIDLKVKKTKKNIIRSFSKLSYYPLSSAQKRIYYAWLRDNHSLLYNIAGGIIVDKLLDINKLQECFRILINRHEALRTHFDIINDEVVQVVDDDIDFKLSLENASSNNLNEIYCNFVKPFDLSLAPLFRTKVVKLNNNKMLILLDMHHIISDGTSLNILLQELCDLYNNNKLSEKQLDYKDFTLWEKAQFETDSFKKSREFWVNQFKDEIPLLNIPTDYPRPSVQSFEGSNYHTKLSKETFDKINKVAQELNITPYMLLLSCYYILLSKYTLQSDIVIGSPIIGRELPELSNMLGMFVNTLAIRNKIEHTLTFKEFTRSTKEICLNSFKNQAYPFDMLINDLNLRRDTSRNPLFDVMFVYQNNGYPKIKFNSADAEYFIPDNNISKFDLTLEIIPINNEYSLRFEYCTKLFKEYFIKGLSLHYINILNTILENVNIKIADIDMISEQEKNQILYEFNNTQVDYLKDKTIIDLFEEQVKRTPDNIAVIFEDKKLTYKELNEKANQLANHLLMHNISDDSIVGIILDRSLEIIISLLAVLKTGACYVPIDKSFPFERIKYMLSNSGCSLLLKKTNINFYDFDNILNIDIDSSDIYITNSKNNINKYISTANRAYIIYTSGSTGKPKGVMLKHSSLFNLTNYLNKTVKYLKNNEHISILSLTTMSFDIFLFETLIPLQKGLTVVLANEKEQSNPDLILTLIDKFNIKSVQMTPSRMKIFVNNNYLYTFNNVKYITLAGEALSKDLRDNLLKINDLTIYNGYGPSETTVYSTFTDATKQQDITIGTPIDNTFMYVLDSDMHLCPIGVPGELYIAGDGVGYGYINNQKLTDKVFIHDIFNLGKTMYKSGDLACYLPNGELKYLGRTDHQVKIRGLRIELDEISTFIKKFPNIKNVVVSSYVDSQDRKSIVAYLLVENRISVNELKQYLVKHIPNYMVPAYFMILDSFPYLPNGKIDKNSLPEPNELKQNTSYVAPKNKLELEIISSMEKLLSIYPISIDDDFFNIGGDSLLAMSLQLDLLNKNIKIEYSDIFINPTAKEMANAILKKSESDTTIYNMSDFQKYNVMLEQTTTLNVSNMKYHKINNVLLAGVTGFLGSHILDALIKADCNKIYCLVRPDVGVSIEAKIKCKLHYYFGNKYDNLFGNKIIPIICDITKSNFGLDDITLNMLSQNTDIVINSAAKVQHYGDISDYKKINIDITKNLANFAYSYKKRFYHISTMSISGNTFSDQSFTKQSFKDDIIFKENNFYIGQNLNNIYVRSKFEAEKIVFDKILDGLDAYILRVGNLMNRFSDLKFQQNSQENAYINRLISFAKLQYIPDYIINGYLEFTPVDYCAESIIHIIEYPSSTNRIFHLLNHNTVDIKHFIKLFNNTISKINVVDQSTFINNINRVIKSNNSDILSGIINDFDKEQKLIYESKIKLNSDFTVKYLQNTDFKWPIITDEYLNKFLNYFLN